MDVYVDYILIDCPPDSCKSLSLLIPMPSMHLRNAVYGRDFVNKSAKLSRFSLQEN